MSPSRLARWRTEVRRVVPRADDELVEEIAQHAEDRWISAHAEGLDPDGCDARALEEIAGWQHVEPPPRHSTWTLAGLGAGLGHDIRYSTRTLRAHAVFSVGVALVSAIATAAGVVAFAILNGILWRPLPYPESDRLTVLWQVRKGEQGQISYPDFADVSGASVFDLAAAISGGRGSLRIGTDILRVNMIEMEASGYTMLGARPLLGRLLDASDSGKPHVMVSHRLWRGALNSDPSIVGRALWMSGRDYTVVGVLQPGFDFELPIAPALKLEDLDLWSMFDRASPFVARRDVTTYEAILRLAPGATPGRARAAVDAIAQRLAAEHPSTNADRTLRLAPLKEEVIAPARRPLALVAFASAVTLILALANVAVLGIIRGTARAGEMAIRGALGAGALRLRRQIFIESVLLACAGAAVGFAAAAPILRGILTTDALQIPRADGIKLDVAAVLYAAAIASCIAAVLTCIPAGPRNPAEALRTGMRTAGRRMRSSRRLAVAIELAVALVVCSFGALLSLSVTRLFAVDPGFDPHAALAVRVSAYAARYPALIDVQNFVGSVVERLRAMPDVQSVAAGSSLPLSGQTSGAGVLPQGAQPSAESRIPAGWQFVTPDYFRTIGMRLTAGRDFTAGDTRHDGHVAIVNESLARLLFHGRPAVGKRIGVGGSEANGDWHEIVGVVPDVRHTALDAAPSPRVYDLFGEHWGRTLYIVVRSKTSEAAPLMASVRRSIQDIDSEAPVFDAATLETLLNRSAAPRRLAAVLAIGMAGVALILALVGVSAVTAAMGAERTREIGIRAALGASPGDLMRFIARESFVTATIGGIAGLVMAVAAVPVLRAQLFNVRGIDIVIVLFVLSFALFVAAVAAAIPPARLAAATDPVVAMRNE